MCVDIKEPLPNASLWDRLKLENEMLRSFYTKVVYKIRETQHNGFHEIGLPFCCIQKKNHQIWSTNEKSIHVSTFQYGSKIQIKEIVQKVMNN